MESGIGLLEAVVVDWGMGGGVRGTYHRPVGCLVSSTAFGT